MSDIDLGMSPCLSKAQVARFEWSNFHPTQVVWDVLRSQDGRGTHLARMGNDHVDVIGHPSSSLAWPAARLERPAARGRRRFRRADRLPDRLRAHCRGGMGQLRIAVVSRVSWRWPIP